MRRHEVVGAIAIVSFGNLFVRGFIGWESSSTTATNRAVVVLN